MANPLLRQRGGAAAAARHRRRTSTLHVPLADLDVRATTALRRRRRGRGASCTSRADDGIVVDGAVRVPWHGTCRRCLEPHRRRARSARCTSCTSACSPTPTRSRSSATSSTCGPSPASWCCWTRPATPLCRPDCAGLCPTCGANLNDGRAATAPRHRPIPAGRRSTSSKADSRDRPAGSNRGGRAANLS